MLVTTSEQFEKFPPIHLKEKLTPTRCRSVGVEEGVRTQGEELGEEVNLVHTMSTSHPNRPKVMM